MHFKYLGSYSSVELDNEIFRWVLNVRVLRVQGARGQRPWEGVGRGPGAGAHPGFPLQACAGKTVLPDTLWLRKSV